MMRQSTSMDFSKAVTLALEACDAYICNRDNERGVLGGYYGQYHGPMGVSRVNKVRNLLSDSNVINDSALVLAIFIAIFGETNVWISVGRSSAFASIISDYWIRADINSPHWYRGVLATSVFPEGLLRLSEEIWTEKSLGAKTMGFYDMKEAVRYILSYVVNNEFKCQKSEIIKSAKEIRKFLENMREEKISPSVFPRVKERYAARADGVARGAFSERKPALPGEVSSLIAKFFTPNQTVNLIVNKKSWDSLKDREEKVMTGKIKI